MCSRVFMCKSLNFNPILESPSTVLLLWFLSELMSEIHELNSFLEARQCLCLILNKCVSIEIVWFLFTPKNPSSSMRFTAYRRLNFGHRTIPVRACCQPNGHSSSFAHVTDKTTFNCQSTLNLKVPDSAHYAKAWIACTYFPAQQLNLETNVFIFSKSHLFQSTSFFYYTRDSRTSKPNNHNRNPVHGSMRKSWALKRLWWVWDLWPGVVAVIYCNRSTVSTRQSLSIQQ